MTVKRHIWIPVFVIAFSYFLGISLKDLQANEPPQVVVECFDRTAFVSIKDGVITTGPEQVCILKWKDKEYIEKKRGML